MPMSSTAIAGLPLAREGERPIAARCGHDLEAVALQPRRHEQEDVLVVVRHENELLAHATSSCSADSCATRAGSWTRNVVPPPSRLATRDRAVVRLDDRARDEEAEAGARHLLRDRSRRAEEAVEDELRLAGAEPDPRVAHLEHRVRSLDDGAHVDAPAGRRELDRVRDRDCRAAGRSFPCHR